MGFAGKIIPHYTYEDWLHWEGKWELIEGHPIAMKPSPVPDHQRASAKIISRFETALEAIGCNKCHVYNFLDYKIEEDLILIPDVLIICGEIKKKFLDFPPALVVEILSPSTALRDRHTKFECYQQQGIRYYLIVDVVKKKLDIYKLVEGVYQLAKADTAPQFDLSDTCSIKPQMATIFD